MGFDDYSNKFDEKVFTSKPDTTPQSEDVLEVVCLADVTPRKIDWLWENRIAIGKVSVLAGDGGRGKSTILCDWAARTSNGERWPDGAKGSDIGGVLILAAEDDVEDTLAPRLVAAGAHLSRILTIRSVRGADQSTRRSFNLQADLAKLESLIKERGNIKLVIIDPISSYLGKVDSHKNADVRSVLEPLAEMAARLRVAVVCNNHFSKAGGNANSRIIGSVAFVNQARAAFIVTPDAEDDSRLLLVQSKMNIGPIKYGLAYRIEGRFIEVNGEEIFTSNIIWESAPITITADEALAAHVEDDESRTAASDAEEFLRDKLSSGPVPATEAEQDARALGITSRTLRRARKKLGVIAEKVGLKEGWTWRLAAEESPKGANPPEEGHTKNVAPFGKVGPLRDSQPAKPPATDDLEIPDFLRRYPASDGRG
jgi:putative DNA primase/helicase